MQMKKQAEEQYNQSSSQQTSGVGSAKHGEEISGIGGMGRTR